MSLDNIIAQLESQKYTALSEGIRDVGRAFAGRKEKQMRMSLLDAQLRKADEERDMAVQKDAILKTDAMVLDKVMALETVGDIEGARQLHKHEMLMRKEASETQIQQLKVAGAKAEWLDRNATLIDNADDEQLSAIMQDIAGRFTDSMTVDPRNPVSINAAIPEGMTDPRQIAEHWHGMAGNVGKGTDMQMLAIAKDTGDAYIKLRAHWEDIKDTPEVSSNYKSAVRERLSTLLNTEEIATSQRNLNIAYKKFKWEEGFAENMIVGLYDLGMFDDINAPPRGIEAAIQYAWENKEKLPLSQLKQEIADKWTVESQKKQSLGTLEQMWQDYTPFDVTEPVLSPPEAAGEGPQSMLPTGTTNLVEELNKFEELREQIK